MKVTNESARVIILAVGNIEATMPAETFAVIPGAPAMEVPDVLSENHIFVAHVELGELKVVEGAVNTFLAKSNPEYIEALAAGKPMTKAEAKKAAAAAPPDINKPIKEMIRKELVAYAESKNIELPGNYNFMKTPTLAEYIVNQETLR